MATGVTNVFTPNTRIKSSEVNQDFTDACTTERHTFTPSGRISASTLDGALAELDDEKPHLVKRQGGSSTNWSTAGTTGYDVTDAVIQCGAVSIAAGATATVTFPTAFTQTPVVVCSLLTANQVTTPLNIISVSTTQVQIKHTQASPAYTVVALWIAIGK